MRLQVQLRCKHFLQTSKECDVLLRERVRIRTTMAHTLHGMHYPLTQHATAATLQVLSATRAWPSARPVCPLLLILSVYTGRGPQDSRDSPSWILIATSGHQAKLDQGPVCCVSEGLRVPAYA